MNEVSTGHSVIVRIRDWWRGAILGDGNTLLRSLFSVIVVTGTLGFLTWYALQHLADLPDLAWRDWNFWSNFAVAFVWYNAAAVVSAANWRWLLGSLGGRLRPGVAESIFLMTQAAKYLPGNVAHLIGRIAVAKARGIAVSVVSASLMFEQVLVILAAVLFVALGYLLTREALLPLIPYLSVAPWLVALGLCAVLVLLFLGPLADWIGRRLPARLRSPVLDLRDLGVLRILGLIVVYWIIFFILGAVVVAIAEAVVGAPALTLSASAVVFAGAWVIGFITPGAPAGIGVRETIMVIGFAPMVGEGTALAIALAMRLLSIVGDGSSFLMGFAGDRLMRPGGLAGKG